jgi:hypothetical protein
MRTSHFGRRWSDYVRWHTLSLSSNIVITLTLMATDAAMVTKAGRLSAHIRIALSFGLFFSIRHLARRSR